MICDRSLDEDRTVLSSRSRNNPILMEAYHVLLGYVELDREGKMIPMDDPGPAWGPADGAGRLRTLGVTHVKRKYVSTTNHTKALYDSEKAFSNIGRGIHFFAKENVHGCQIRSYIFYPVVLAFYENEKGDLQLSAFTARCLTSRLAARLAIRQFERVTGSFLSRDEREREAKLKRKEERKKQQEERRAAREEEKNRIRAAKDAEKEEDRKFEERIREEERLRLEAMEKDLDAFEQEELQKEEAEQPGRKSKKKGKQKGNQEESGDA